MMEPLSIHDIINESGIKGVGIKQSLKLKELIREYAAQKCKGQRKICSEEAKLEATGKFDSPFIIDRDSIINAPAPNFD